MFVVLAVFEMFLFEEVWYFLIDFLFDGGDEMVKIVEIFLGEFSLMKVDVVDKVLGGWGKNIIEVVETLVHFSDGVHRLELISIFL